MVFLTSKGISIPVLMQWPLDLSVSFCFSVFTIAGLSAFHFFAFHLCTMHSITAFKLKRFIVAVSLNKFNML